MATRLLAHLQYAFQTRSIDSLDISQAYTDDGLRGSDISKGAFLALGARLVDGACACDSIWLVVSTRWGGRR